MKKLLLSSVALVGLTAGALAADLPARTMAPAPPPMITAVPVFTWSGFYVGVNAGWGWNDDDDNGLFGVGTGNYEVPVLGGGIAAYTLTNPTTGFGNGNNDGFIGGAQIGYNFQVTPGSGFVWGIEADIQGVFNDDDDDFVGTGPTFYNVVPTAPGVTGTGLGVGPAVAGAPGNLALFEQGGAFGNNGLDWFSTVRLRAGFAFDRMLIYATGGLAFGEGGNNNDFIAFNGSNIPAPFFVSPAAATAGAGVNNAGIGFDNGDIDWGWALGGGVEFALANNMTIKLEGLWVNLDRNNNVFGTGGSAGVTNTGAPVRRTDAGFGFNNNDSSDFFVLRGGLNFKFNTF